MRVALYLDPVSAGDLADLERMLVLIRRQFSDSPVAETAVLSLLTALDIYRAHGHRRRGAVTVRLTSGQDDPEEERLAIERLALAVQVGRDAVWLSDALRMALAELLGELLDALKAQSASADAIRMLYVAPASRNPREAA